MTGHTLTDVDERPAPPADPDELHHVVCSFCYPDADDAPGKTMLAVCGHDVTHEAQADGLPDVADVCVVCLDYVAARTCNRGHPV